MDKARWNGYENARDAKNEIRVNRNNYRKFCVLKEN